MLPAPYAVSIMRVYVLNAVTLVTYMVHLDAPKLCIAAHCW